MAPLITAFVAAALLSRVGFALYATGLVRAKNSAGMVLRLICDLCIFVLAYWAVGAGLLLHGNNEWFSFNRDMLFGPQTEKAVFLMPSSLFFMVMMLSASSVVTGALAERCRFFPPCVVSLVLSGLVFPVVGHWAWFGWFSRHGFVDFAGATVLHVSAGVFAAVGAGFVGPRVGKFNKDRSSSMIPGHNLPLASIGAMLMLVGWVTYVAGITGKETIAAMNVLLAASAAGLTAILVSQFRYGKPDILLTLSGLLGGLVAICAGGAEVPGWAAVVIGAVAGVIVPLAVVFIDLRMRLDDPLGVIAIHAVGGIWGTIATGFFLIIGPGAKFNRWQLVAIQLAGLVVIALVSAVVALILFAILKATMGLRPKEADEFDGLDLAEHDIGAYPDFQQNSIKSYHLREA